MKLPQLDLPPIVGVIALAEIASLALLVGGQPGITVAAGAAGAIGGWLAKSLVQKDPQP